MREQTKDHPQPPSLAMDQQKKEQVPHVLVYPLPAQGHINTMMRLANLLCLSGVTVTFLNSEYNHDRLRRNGQLADRPGLRFRAIWDGLPPDHPRSAERLMDLVDSLANTKAALREMLVRWKEEEGEEVTCMIGDGSMMFTMEVAEDLGLPFIAFRTISACSFWAYFSISWLVQSQELPFSEEDFDKEVKGVPGMESFLRRRDLPSFCRAKELNDQTLQFIWDQTNRTTQAPALILNTFEDLEAPILAHIRAHFPSLYVLGPLHSLLCSKLASEPTPNSVLSSSSLWTVEPTCINWLNTQPLNSVLYISFGSYAVLTRAQLLEFWHGLIDSQKRFLWVIRPGLVDEAQPPKELIGPTRERGLIVGWAPQEEVLAHRAVGGFLTHSGWNSTIESLSAGVPMICWPFFADQQINSRYVSHVWRVGLDMKDTCDRSTVERMVRELMDDRRDEMQRYAAKIEDQAKRSVSKDLSLFAGLTNDPGDKLGVVKAVTYGVPEMDIGQGSETLFCAMTLTVGTEVKWSECLVRSSTYNRSSIRAMILNAMLSRTLE